jgi:hypothetical protein
MIFRPIGKSSGETRHVARPRVTGRPVLMSQATEQEMIMIRRIRNSAIFALAVLILVTGMGLLSGLGGQVAHAVTVTCRTTHTYSHTVTSAGSQSWTWTTRYACGRNYRKWEHRVSASYTGSWYVEDVYRDEMRYPHYWQHTHKDAHSKTGRETVTDTYTSA